MPPFELPSMGRPPKLLVPFLAALGGLGAAALIIVGQQQVRQLQQQLALSHQHLVRLEAENKGLTERLDGLEGQRKDLDHRLLGLREQLSAATAELDRSRIALKDVEDRYVRASEERAQLQTQVATLTSQREETAKQVQQLESENTQLQRTASRLRERFTLLDRDYRALAEKLSAAESARQVTIGGAPLLMDGTTPPVVGQRTETSLDRGIVELPPIIVRKDQAGTSMPVRGRVIQADDTHNFVVVDKGSEDGVRAGMTLSIVRGGSTVGRVSVIRVRPHLSACDILRSSTPGPLQMGDLVVEGGS